MADILQHLITPIVLALIAAAPGVLALIRAERKDRAAAINEENEAANRISQAALELVQPYRERVKELEAQVKALNKRVDELAAREEYYNYLKRGARRLENQVKSLGADPVYHVPDTGELK